MPGIEKTVSRVYAALVNNMDSVPGILASHPISVLVGIADMLHIEPYTVAGNPRSRQLLTRLIDQELNGE